MAALIFCELQFSTRRALPVFMLGEWPRCLSQSWHSESRTWLSMNLVPGFCQGMDTTLLAAQAVCGQLCCAERLFLGASVCWGRKCQGHHCIASLGRKLLTSVLEMGFQMAPSFKWQSVLCAAGLCRALITPGMCEPQPNEM